jgi:hypothetical protein
MRSAGRGEAGLLPWTRAKVEPAASHGAVALACNISEGGPLAVDDLAVNAAGESE